MEVGINLFSVLEPLSENFTQTMRKVAMAGYRNVELLAADASRKRFSDRLPVSEIRQTLETNGMTPIASHEGLQPGLEPREMDWDFIIDYNAVLGVPRIVLPSIRIMTREETLRWAEQLNVIGEKCAERGMQFYVHNHALEFRPLGDTTLFHLLMAQTDASLVKVELDLAWVLRGGQNPIALLDQLGERCDLIHQRDFVMPQKHPLNVFREMAEDESRHPYHEVHLRYRKPDLFVDLGRGAFDFAAVYEKIRADGHVHYAIVENDGDRVDKWASLANDLHVLGRYAK